MVRLRMADFVRQLRRAGIACGPNRFRTELQERDSALLRDPQSSWPNAAYRRATANLMGSAVAANSTGKDGELWVVVN